MMFVTPLVREDLARIPTSIEGKFYLGGPYTFDDLLREPDDYGDEEIDWHSAQIKQSGNVQARTAQIDITSAHHRVKPGAWPGGPSRVDYTMRYLYREAINTEILGVVLLKVSHEIHGVSKGFQTVCKKVIQSIYVRPSNQGRGIARILLAVVLEAAPDVCVHPQFSVEGARLFGFDREGRRG
ncbi:hypothetical protein P245_21005 [Comamonas thiooxydans]|uniref:N-acetyltransferase domain-containing protein n=1 Tax=Comamonas thiooxydans TaxID=363952 RepID=A0A0E3BC33_9BURK|nr:hypothetical protein P245_21005 [Comamonas thiooxydans]